MPAKNSLKFYLENSYYHIYNRGAGKSKIFKDKQDYQVFLDKLKKYLDPKSQYSFDKKINLSAYCLMPNHFHFFVFQKTKDGMEAFMRSLGTSYAMYFNKKYERSGTLFQGRYKAAIVETEPYFLHLSRYIHLNPAELVNNWREYPYSSYKNYIGQKEDNWLTPDPILTLFKKGKGGDSYNRAISYQEFVEGFTGDSKDQLDDLAID